MFTEVKKCEFFSVFSRALILEYHFQNRLIVATAVSLKGMILYDFILRLHPSKTLLENLKSLNFYQDVILL